MGLDKFLKDDEKDELVLTKKDYKSKVNNIVKNTFEKDNLNLLQIEKESSVNKKVAMSVYFDKEDLDLLKAIAFEKSTTVNKVIMNIIKTPLENTRLNLPDNFDIDDKVKKYEVNSKKRKVETRGRKKKEK